MDEVMTVAELIEVLSDLNPGHEIYVLINGEYGGVEDVRVDDGAERVTLISPY